MSASAMPRAAARVTAGREPRFSILTVVAEPSGELPGATLDSLEAQTLGSWELCTAASRDGGSAAALDEALAAARGDFLLLLDPGDRLHREALERLDAVLAATPGAEIAYSDEEWPAEGSRRARPFFKPDFSPERLRTQMYVGRACALRRSAVEDAGGFDPAMEGAHEWDLVLRVSERGGPVAHVPRILYSRGRPPADSPEAAIRAVRAHCARIGLEGRPRADDAHRGVLHLEPALASRPSVSIVIPTAGRSRAVRGQETVLVANCVRSVLSRSTYDRYDLVCVVDASTDPAVLGGLREIGGDRLRLVEFQGDFNFSAKVNRGARETDGEYLVLLNDDTEVITADWLERLLMYAKQEAIGAVGARLLREDGRLQHVGIVFEDGLAGHLYDGSPGHLEGHQGSVITAQNYLAVTAACLMTPRAAFEEVGGFDEELPVNYNDVDYCLKQVARGRRVVYDPDTALHHFESSSRRGGAARWETRRLRERWRDRIEPDPFSNPGLRYGRPRRRSPRALLPGSVRRWLR